MKNTSSKNIKRSISPLIPKVSMNLAKTIQASQRKKKSMSNNPYAKIMKQFQTYGKNDKKKGHYVKETIRGDGSKNKYRIVTEPVDDRIMHLAKGNIFNSSFGRIPHSRKKLQTEIAQHNNLKFNVRTSSHSKDKLRIIECRNCQRYADQIDFLKSQMNKIFLSKVLWKNGQITLAQTKQQFGLQVYTGTAIKTDFKSIQGIIMQTKKHFLDLMKDIESLGSIDYAKMLSLDVFTYQPSFSSYPDHQYAEVKSLISQLRSNMEGKITDNDLEDIDMNSSMANMLRNLKNRLSNCLRQNLQLKIKKTVLSKADEIALQSEQYLKKIIEDVLVGYTKKNI